MTTLFISTRTGNIFEIGQIINGEIRLDNIGHIAPTGRDFEPQPGIPMTVTEEWLNQSVNHGFMEPAILFQGQVIPEYRAQEIQFATILKY